MMLANSITLTPGTLSVDLIEDTLYVHWIDVKTDGHVHTRLCHHASGEMEEYVQAAIARGLEKIIFLEHLEMGIRYFESTWLSEEDFAYYFKEGERLREKYRGAVEIGLGVEVGELLLL